MNVDDLDRSEKILLLRVNENGGKANVNMMRYVDATQLLVDSFILNKLFPWLCLVLIINRNDWKRPVILILILHWFFKSISDLLKNYYFYTDTAEYERNGYQWPYTHLNLVCLKCGGPFIFKNGITWWIIALISQVVCSIYDISIMIALKKSLFDKLETFKYKSNSFLEKFKQISELRIIISLIISFLFFPWPIVQVHYYLNKINQPLKVLVSHSHEVDHFRGIVISFVYTSMYIDQILLRFYIQKNRTNDIGLYSPCTRLLIHPPNLSITSNNSTSLILNNNTSNNNSNNNNNIDISRLSYLIQSGNDIKASYYLHNLKESLKK
ncbi:hypothetical protein PIROE2DRAFT_8478 [Piromyces sp. E2]|nr:hypothetical protein PIROE2DRAFT_8478 [Piromyces sp. E2]|eukprot:OUM64710.1 hypothetical protein PIROE2DRAFT_8478 [Piromyces sp. E2]